MSDRIEVMMDRSYLEKPLNEFMGELNRRVRERYPGYSIAWLTDASAEIIEKEIEEIGVKEAKVVELEVNILPVLHVGVLVPEGREFLSAPA